MCCACVTFLVQMLARQTHSCVWKYEPWLLTSVYRCAPARDCVCAYIYVCVRTYMCVCVHIYTRMCINTITPCVRMRARAHMCTSGSVCVCARLCVRVYIYIYMCMCMHMNVYAYACVCNLMSPKVWGGSVCCIRGEVIDLWIDHEENRKNSNRHCCKDQCLHLPDSHDTHTDTYMNGILWAKQHIAYYPISNVGQHARATRTCIESAITQVCCNLHSHIYSYI